MCRELGDVFRKLAEQKESFIEEGSLPDHVHMMISVAPERAVSQEVGFIKGKSARHIARAYGIRKQLFRGPTHPGRREFRLDGGSR